jgi:hypothetical protein
MDKWLIERLGEMLNLVPSWLFWPVLIAIIVPIAAFFCFAENGALIDLSRKRAYLGEKKRVKK